MAPAPQPRRRPSGPPSTPTSIPISEPPRRAETEAVGALRDTQLALRRAFHDRRGLQSDAATGVTLLQDTQGLVGVAQLREPNDHHVLLSHCSSLRSITPYNGTLAPVAANPMPHRGAPLPLRHAMNRLSPAVHAHRRGRPDPSPRAASWRWAVPAAVRPKFRNVPALSAALGAAEAQSRLAHRLSSLDQSAKGISSAGWSRACAWVP